MGTANMLVLRERREGRTRWTATRAPGTDRLVTCQAGEGSNKYALCACALNATDILGVSVLFNLLGAPHAGYADHARASPAASCGHRRRARSAQSRRKRL